MTKNFQSLVSDTRAFMSELAEINNRAWFAENKERYDTTLKKPAKDLLASVAAELEKMLDQSVSTKLFRPHRDVRFSKNKTPYTLHLHLVWTPQGSGTQPAYFFGIAKDYVTAGAGLMGFDKTQQSAWRAWVSEREGDALQTRLDTAARQGATLREPELKRVPSPFDKDHPRATLLRRKSLALWKDIEAEADKGVIPALMKTYKLVDPVMEDLRSFL